MLELIAALTRAMPEGPILVGFSGGLDSTVLLHALNALPCARARGLRALHVRHDLHPAAAQWARQCQQTCRDWDIPIEVARVQVRQDSGLGLEAAAREARHGAFAAALAPGETLALAHHRRDQAETVLLRLLRASGSEGLGAMRAMRAIGAGRLWRPLLDIPPEALAAYARARGLEWLEDPSNTDTRFERNFLRHRVLPLLRERWPQAVAAFARSAALLAEDAMLLADAAHARLLRARTPDPCTLATPPLLSLSPAWRTRVLRLWLAQLGLPSPPGRAFALIDQELLHSRHDAQPEYRWAGLRLQRWRQLLHVAIAQSVPPRLDCEWSGQSRLELPGGGSLEMLREPADATLALPEDFAPLRVLGREGGERIRLPGRRHSHALKDCLLRSGLPPW
ncbi:MAG: tRNA lysidine(34) synthetase TilS, partial [Arenimonas sp.]